MAALEARLGSTAPETRLALAALRVTTLMRDGRFEDVRRVIEHVESMFGHAPKVAQWATYRWRAALAHVTADMDAAETFARKSMQVAAGTRRASSVAEFSAILLGYVMRERRTQSTGLPIMRGWVESRPHYLPYRAALAWILADMGNVNEAETQLTRVFESDLSKHRQAAEWLPLVTMAGMAAATIDNAEWASMIVDLTEPHREEWVVVGTGVAVDGPVSLRRGFMAATSGQLDIASADIEHGEAAARRAGAHTFVIMAQSYRARLEILEGRPDVAATSYLAAANLSKAHGLDAWSGELRAKAAASTSRQPASSTTIVATVKPRVGRFMKVGKVWQVHFDGSTITVADMKGMPMLLELLRSPNTDIHVRELSVVADGISRGSSNDSDLSVRGGWGSDPVLDDQAIQSYRARVLDLQRTMDDTSADNDLERVAIAEAELDALLDELKRSSGLRGRVRVLDKSSERARVRVTKALRTAVRRINDASPLIGGHLQAAVQTGTFCAYRPDPSLRIVWEL
ncbi:MAG TPA: hypothetical protein ENH15_03145 [Actinobacteria bacterium]|nr:hypothetical protein [Actinomycetota bacterium]